MNWKDKALKIVESETIPGEPPDYLKDLIRAADPVRLANAVATATIKSIAKRIREAPDE